MLCTKEKGRAADDGARLRLVQEGETPALGLYRQHGADESGVLERTNRPMRPFAPRFECAYRGWREKRLFCFCYGSKQTFDRKIVRVSCSMLASRIMLRKCIQDCVQTFSKRAGFVRAQGKYGSSRSGCFQAWGNRSLKQILLAWGVCFLQYGGP